MSCLAVHNSGLEYCLNGCCAPSTELLPRALFLPKFLSLLMHQPVECLRHLTADNFDYIFEKNCNELVVDGCLREGMAFLQNER